MMGQLLRRHRRAGPGRVQPSAHGARCKARVPTARRVPRRLTAVVALFLSPFVLASCGSNDTPSGEPSSAGAAKPSNGGLESIYFANPLPDNPSWITVDRCVKAEAERHGIRATSSGPSGPSVKTQFTLDRLSQAIATGADAIILVPITPNFTPLMERAKAKGIHVAALNTGSTTSAQDFVVGIDYAQFGADVAEAIGSRPGQQKLGIVTNGPGGVGDVIIKSVKSHLPPNVSVVAEAFDAGDPAKTADVAATMMEANPSINFLWSWQGTAVGGMITAIKERDAVGKVVALTGDLTPQVIAGIRDRIIYGSMTTNWCSMATKAVQLLVDLSAGKPVPPATDTGATLVNTANLDAMIKELKDAGQLE